eukprot:9238946-Ditylum_brightwellii.AAC.1
MSYVAGGLMQGVPQSIGPDGQQRHEDGVKKQEQAFKRTKMALQDERQLKQRQMSNCHCPWL